MYNEKDDLEREIAKQERENYLDNLSQREHSGDSLSEYEKRRDEAEYGA